MRNQYKVLQEAYNQVDSQHNEVQKIVNTCRGIVQGYLKLLNNKKVAGSQLADYVQKKTNPMLEYIGSYIVHSTPQEKAKLINYLKELLTTNWLEVDNQYWVEEMNKLVKGAVEYGEVNLDNLEDLAETSPQTKTPYNKDYFAKEFTKMVRNVINANSYEEFVAAANKHFVGSGKKYSYNNIFLGAIRKVIDETNLFSEEDAYDLQLVLYWAIRAAWYLPDHPDSESSIEASKEHWNSFKQAYDQAKQVKGVYKGAEKDTGWGLGNIQG